MRVGELHFTGCNAQESRPYTSPKQQGRTGPGEEVAGELALEGMRTGRLTSSDIIQAQIQGFELTHLTTYPIHEWLSA